MSGISDIGSAGEAPPEISTFGVSVEVQWRTWRNFRTGKRRTPEIDAFEYGLERELANLSRALSDGSYRHGPYRTFEVAEQKRRIVSVAAVRDRVVHRLLYDHVVACFDARLSFDAWSCRKGKGLLGAIRRAQSLLARHPGAWAWRAGASKFFDSVRHDRLIEAVERRVLDPRARWLTREIVGSYRAEPTGDVFARERERERTTRHTHRQPDEPSL